MKKIDIKNKSLKIKNKSLIKEDWTSELPGGKAYVDIVKTGLLGTYEAFKRAWNTCVVLPWKIIIAFKDGKSLEQVMVEWEQRDKSIKQTQMNIIKNTGVSETVDAFIGVCNPGALMFQKFVEWENADMKRRWKQGSSSVWDNTIGLRFPELKINAQDSDKQKYSAQIVYSNFVVSVCRAIGISIEQKKYNSYEEIQFGDRSFKKSIQETEAISKKSIKYRNFIKYLIIALKEDSGITHKISGDTYKSFIEKSETLSNQVETIEKSLFKVIADRGITSSSAADIIMANRLGTSLEKIADFIEKASGIKNKFKSFSNMSSREKSEELKQTSSETEETPAETEETPAETEEIKASANESIFFKSLLIKNNSIILENNIISELKRRKNKKAEKHFMDMMVNYYFTHLRVITAAKSIIATHITIMKYENTYRVYEEIIKNIENENYETSNIKAEENSVELEKYIPLLKSISEYMEKVSKASEVLKSDDVLTKKLIKEITEKKFDGQSILDDMDKRFKGEDTESLDNMINDFARLSLSKDDSSRYENLKKIKFSDEEISKKAELIKNSLSSNDIKEINEVLVAASTARVWENFAKEGLIDKNIDEITNSFNNISKIKQELEKVLTKSMRKKLINTLPDFVKNCIETIEKTNINLENSLDKMVNIKNFDYDSIAKKLEESAEAVLKIRAEENKETDQESEVSQEENIIDVSGDSSNTIAKVD